MNVSGSFVARVGNGLLWKIKVSFLLVSVLREKLKAGGRGCNGRSHGLTTEGNNEDPSTITNEPELIVAAPKCHITHISHFLSGSCNVTSWS
jgi:hypothetical protein